MPQAIDVPGESTVVRPTAVHDGADPAPRYGAFDALRGLMMLLGIYLHAAVAYSGYGSWPWKDGTSTGVFDITVGLIHVFRMPVFYVMAGFFAALLLERRGCAGFIRNRASRILLPFVGGWLVLFPLVAALAVAGENLKAPGSALVAAIHLFTSLDILDRRPDPMHLWFLEYLLMFYAVIILAMPLSRWVARVGAWADRAFRASVRSPAGPLVLSVPMCPILWLMDTGAIDDTYGFAPAARIFGAYAVFFGWGWVLWRNADLLPALRNPWRGTVWLVLGAIAALIGYVLWYWRRVHGLALPLVSVASAWCLAFAMWSFVLGFIGVFLRLVDRPVAWIRYVADSSYWMYLAHMPVLLAFQLLLAQAECAPAIKAMTAFAGSVAVLLGSYHVLVRPTWLGAILNGRRQPTRGIGAIGVDAATDAPVAVRELR